MIPEIDKRIGESYKQLTVLIACQNLNLKLLTQIYKNTKAKNENEFIDQYDKIAKLLPNELLEIVAKDKIKAVHNYLISHYFVSLITLFETLLFDLQKIVLLQYPLKIPNFSIEFNDIVEAENKEQIISFAIDKYLMSISYQKPLKYKESFLKIISAKKEFLKDEWIKYIEMKARRDLGVHNNWFINDTYLRKIAEVGLKHTKSDKYLFPTETYFNKGSMLIDEMIMKIGMHCEEKFV